MRFLTEKNALLKLEKLSRDHTEVVRREFEFKAKQCAVCKTPGVCCVDEHFVNVQISKLEALHINNEINKLPLLMRATVKERINNAAEQLRSDPDHETFSCPLYQTNVGCLVHNAVKPVPCVQHACYDDQKDLPPDELQFEQEIKIAKLNKMTYGREITSLPLPLALLKNISIVD